jgi:DNA-binding IclR family transcriptional regulator
MPTIQSVDRALQILDLFDEQNKEIKITDISARTGLNKSTLHALLKTLQARGYIDQNDENGRYRLGMKLVERGNFVINSIDIRKICNSFLVDLSAQTGQTTHLGILDGGHGIYIDKVEGQAAIITYSRIGRQLPLHCTAIGKVLVAFQNAERRAQLLLHYDYAAMTGRSITGETAFMEELAQVRAQGCALDDQENVKGVRCVAVPLFDHRGHIAAAISLSTLTSIVDSRDFARYSGFLQDIGRQISVLLGHR